ncbi:MAG: HDOD domain-containing protein [Pseudomonadota bacterium]
MPLVRPNELSAKDAPATGVAALTSLKIEAERVSASLDALGPLPTIAMEILSLADDPATDGKRLADHIARDQIIAGKVLKLANSAFYSKGAATKTLQAAGLRLGTQSIKNLVLSTCTSKKLAKPLANYDYTKVGLWQHSLATALYGQLLPADLGLPRKLGDELFIAGLLHDIGKLVLDPILTEPIRGTGSNAVEQEVRQLGISHAQIGIEVASRWRLPDIVADVIEFHHQPEKTERNEQIVAAVCLLDHLVNAARYGLPPLPPEECEAVSPPLAALEILSLTEADVAGLQQRIEDERDEVLAACELLE